MNRTSTSDILAVSGRPLVVLLTGGFVLAGLLLALLFDPLTGWTLMAGALALVLFIGRPTLLLATYWFWSATSHLIGTIFYRRIFGLVDEMLVAVMFVVVAAEIIINKRRDPALRSVDRTVAVLLLLSALTGYINHVRLMPAIRFLSAYLGFFVVFYLSYFHLRGIKVRLFIMAIFLMFALQFALDLAWFLGVNPLPNYRWGTVDFSIGSMGSCDLVAYFSLFVLFLILPMWRHFYQPFARLMIGALALAVLFQLYLTFTNHVYVLLLGGLTFQLFSVLRRFRERAQVALLGALCVGLALLLRPPTHVGEWAGDTAFYELRPEHLLARFQAMITGSKGEIYRNVFVLAFHDTPVPLLGAGPGNFASAIGVQFRSALAERYINYMFLDYSGRMMMTGSSITQNVITGVAAIWSELGLPGFLAMFGLHIYAIRRIWRQQRLGLYRDPWRRILAEAFVPGMGCVLLLNILTDIFPHDLMQGGIWMCAALVWSGDAPPAPAATPETAGKKTPPSARPRLSTLAT